MSEREETLWRVWERRTKLTPSSCEMLFEKNCIVARRGHAYAPSLLRATPTRFVGRPTMKKAAHHLPACALCPSRALRVVAVVVHVRAAPELAALRSLLLPRCNCEYHPPPTQKGWAMLSCMEEGLKNNFITQPSCCFHINEDFDVRQDMLKSHRSPLSCLSLHLETRF